VEIIGFRILDVNWKLKIEFNLKSRFTDTATRQRSKPSYYWNVIAGQDS
jgi:hypothetical protein